jgi:hypothetical protein
VRSFFTINQGRAERAGDAFGAAAELGGKQVTGSGHDAVGVTGSRRARAPAGYSGPRPAHSRLTA